MTTPAQVETPNGAPRFDETARATELLREFVKLSRRFERKLEELTAVNPTDRVVMEKLIEGGPQTPSELAAAVGITPAAMTTSLDRLDELGHAHRAPHETDRRKILVSASPESTRVIMSEVMAMVRDVNEVTAEFSEDELATITRFLDRIVTVYDQHSA